MRNLILLLSILSFYVLSCDKEPDEPDQNGDPSDNPSLLEADIGSAGGKLETEDFILTVPEGAFDTTATLKLTLIENDPTQDAAQVTGTYKLTGLNCQWNKPLEFKIRYSGTLQDENFIALGYTYFDPESEDSVRVSELIDAVDSEGFLSGTLPPLEAPDAGVKAAPHGEILYHPLVFHNYLTVRGIFKKTATVHSESVRIRYDAGLSVNQLKVDLFAQYVEEAVSFFHVMGLMDMNTLGGDYKIRVEIFDDPDLGRQPCFIEPKFESLEAFPLQSRYKILTNVYLISIPVSYFVDADDNQLRMVAGQGVFRFENYCYFREVKKTMSWLQWALNYWVREYFHGSNPEYDPVKETYPMFMQPFHGMNVVIKDDPDIFPRTYELSRRKLHGYGMSSLMKYLFETYNDNFDLLSDLFSEMLAESGTRHPINAIFNSIDDPEYNWWPAFLKEYLTGNIWEIPPEKFLEEVDWNDEVHFMDEIDTVKHFDRSYMDLSAGICKVNLATDLAQSVLDEEDKLNFKLGPKSLNMDYVTVLVFKYKEGHLTFMDEGPEVTIDQVKGLIDDGYTTLLAVVVNCASEYPYEEEMNIELTMRMIGKRTWPWKYVTFDAAVTNAVFRSNAGDESSWDEFTFNLTDKLLEVSEDGSRFTASWLDQTEYSKYEGGIDITIDPETSVITGFNAWSNSESISDGKVTTSERYDMEGEENLSIPLVYSDDDYLTHQISGEEVCSSISLFTYSYRMYPGESYEYSNTLESYSCNEEANLLFLWARDKDQ